MSTYLSKENFDAKNHHYNHLVQKNLLSEQDLEMAIKAVFTMRLTASRALKLLDKTNQKTKKRRAQRKKKKQVKQKQAQEMDAVFCLLTADTAIQDRLRDFEGD